LKDSIPILAPSRGLGEALRQLAREGEFAESNELQHKYCQLKGQYEERYRQMKRAVRRYEFRVREDVTKNQEYFRRDNLLR
jgi:hypothetical protein